MPTVGGCTIANNYHSNLPDDIGVLAPGGGTRGITPAAQAELTRQHSQNISFPTRALGIALGAAETLVPAAGSPKETLRTLAKAARDYIVTGQDKSLPGFATLGFARAALEHGVATGTAAAAGDPHAQGAALAAVGGAALATRGAFYGRATEALPPRAAVDLTPSLKPLPDLLDVPTYQRATAPVRQRFATDAEVRLHNLRQRYANHTAETILPAPTSPLAELQAQGFIGTGPESITLADVLKTKIIGAKPKGRQTGPGGPQTVAGPGTKSRTFEDVAKQFQDPEDIAWMAQLERADKKRVTGRGSRLWSDDRPNESVIITRNTIPGEQPWRVTHMDSENPTQHVGFDSELDAVHWAHISGYFAKGR